MAKTQASSIYIGGISALQYLLSRGGCASLERDSPWISTLKPTLSHPLPNEIPNLAFAQGGFPQGIRTTRLSVNVAQSADRPRAQLLRPFCWSVSTAGTYLRISKAYCVLSPEALFVQMSYLLGFFRAVEIGFALCGTYAPGGTSLPSTYGIAPLTTTRKISNYLSKLSNVRGLSIAKRAIAYVRDNSGSEQESKLACYFSLSNHYGGMGLPPILNKAIELTNVARGQGNAKTRRPDLLWEPSRVVLDYDGRLYHDLEEQSAVDRQRRNEFAAMGYTALIARHDDVQTPKALWFLGDQVVSAMHYHPRIRTMNYEQKRLLLWRHLYGDLSFRPMDLTRKKTQRFSA